MFGSKMYNFDRRRASLCLSIIAFSSLILALTFGAFAQEAQTARDMTAETQEGRAQAGSDPLVVPIFPRYTEEQNLKDIESLKDNYIVLEDGAIISVADWLLGSLTKSSTGLGMSDYENRLFLGQVARAAAGLNEDLVYRSFENAGPPRTYVPHTPPAPLQAAQGFLSFFIPALRPGWKPTVPEFTLARSVGHSTDGTILFNRQFQDALSHSTEDLIYFGTFTNMLEDQKKKQSN